MTRFGKVEHVTTSWVRLRCVLTGWVRVGHAMACRVRLEHVTTSCQVRTRYDMLGYVRAHYETLYVMMLCGVSLEHVTTCSIRLRQNYKMFC